MSDIKSIRREKLKSLNITETVKPECLFEKVHRLRKEKQELLERLKEIEEWEAELIKTDECWQGNKGLPKFNQKLYDDWIKLQSKINKITQKYEEGENE